MNVVKLQIQCWIRKSTRESSCGHVHSLIMNVAKLPIQLQGICSRKNIWGMTQAQTEIHSWVHGSGSPSWIMLRSNTQILGNVPDSRIRCTWTRGTPSQTLACGIIGMSTSSCTPPNMVMKTCNFIEVAEYWHCYGQSVLLNIGIIWIFQPSCQSSYLRSWDGRRCTCPCAFWSLSWRSCTQSVFRTKNWFQILGSRFLSPSTYAPPIIPRVQNIHHPVVVVCVLWWK